MLPYVKGSDYNVVQEWIDTYTIAGKIASKDGDTGNAPTTSDACAVTVVFEYASKDHFDEDPKSYGGYDAAKQINPADKKG